MLFRIYLIHLLNGCDNIVILTQKNNNQMIKTHYKTVLIICLVLIFGCRTKQKNLNSKEGNFISEADSIPTLLNTYYKKGKLNGNVLVAKNGKIIYEHSFGYAGGEKDQLLTSEYRFNIGSVNKEFPAVAIMQLYERNKIDLTDKIDTYLPKLPDWSSRVSIKNLLRYSSGLPEIDFVKYISKNKTVTEERVFNDLLNMNELKFEPGTDYLYTNYSPYLLSKIVEKITDMQFSTYAQKNLFAPANMNSTVYKKQYPYQDKHLMALPFNEQGVNDYYKIKTPFVLLVTTADDMYHWFKALASFELISKESFKFLSKTAIAGPEVHSPLGEVQWANNKLIKHFHKGGAGKNYSCLVHHYKQDQLTIVILTNQEDSNEYEIASQIRAITNN